ncbi:MAG: ComEC/Rec2 family competence protein [bacterium]
MYILALAFIGGVFLLHVFGVVQYEFVEVRDAPGILQPTKMAFQNTLRQYISPPEGAILGAMTLGDKSKLSRDTKEKLNKAGVRHITAISGMHISILTILLMSMFLWFGMWRSHAFYITAIIMLLYILLTGASPSAIRAGVMGSAVLFAPVIGRMNVSLRMLVFAAAGILAFDVELLGNIGFQLSFLAVFGIITISPLLQNMLEKFPNPWHFQDILIMTISAQVFTLPILLSNFGQISLVSVPANLLIVLVLPFVLAFGFLFLIVGTLVQPLAFILSLPVSLLLHYMTFVIDLFSELSFASFEAEPISPFWFAFLYAPLLFILWKHRKRQGIIYQWLS